MPTGREIIWLIERLGVDEVYACPLWTVGDIFTEASKTGVGLTKDEAEEVLEEVHHHHGAEQGITWDTLYYALPDKSPELEWLRASETWFCLGCINKPSKEHCSWCLDL